MRDKEKVIFYAVLWFCSIMVIGTIFAYAVLQYLSYFLYAGWYF
jgi:hypothetical protein